MTEEEQTEEVEETEEEEVVDEKDDDLNPDSLSNSEDLKPMSEIKD